MGFLYLATGLSFAAAGVLTFTKGASHVHTKIVGAVAVCLALVAAPIEFF